jgi:hypothetical protein
MITYEASIHPDITRNADYCRGPSEAGRIVGGHEKLPTGGHESAHARPIRTAHWQTRKCPLAAMNLPRPV